MTINVFTHSAYMYMYVIIEISYFVYFEKKLHTWFSFCLWRKYLSMLSVFLRAVGLSNLIVHGLKSLLIWHLGVTPPLSLTNHRSSYRSPEHHVLSPISRTSQLCKDNQNDVNLKLNNFALMIYIMHYPRCMICNCLPHFRDATGSIPNFLKTSCEGAKRPSPRKRSDRGGEGVGGGCPPSHGVELFCFSMWNFVFWCILQRVFSHITTHYFSV